MKPEPPINSTKYHPLDPRHIYKSFMTAIVFQAEKEGVASGEDGESPPQSGQNGSSKLPALSNLYNISRFELFGSKVAAAEEEATETLRCLWPFFRLGRLIGMCPITRRGSHLVVGKHFHGSWIATWIALLVQIIMVGNAVKQAQKAENTEVLVKRFNSIIYYGHTLLNCCYMSWKIKDLPQFLVSCKRVENVCKKHQSHQLKPDRLVRDCFLLFVFFTTSQCIGNILYLMASASKAKVKSLPEFFKSFNSDFIGHWGSFYSGIFFCFGDLYCDMGWGFADILLALISVVFGRFFKRLNTILRSKKTWSSLSLAKIEELRCDHREICHLVQICNNIFSPLFLLTYVANIGYLFTRLYTGLSDDLEDPTFVVRFESMYAFCYQILVKILTPSYLAARLHEQAHEGLKLIHNWPSSIEAPDSKSRLLVIGRFVSQLVTTPVGISGCGYFIISKSFMVTLISALVTYEVIILQFQGASLKSE